RSRPGPGARARAATRACAATGSPPASPARARVRRRGTGSPSPGRGRRRRRPRPGERHRPWRQCTCARRRSRDGDVPAPMLERPQREPGAPMAKTLEGKTVAILATDGVEQVELTEPRKAVEAAGATVRLLSLEPGGIQGMHHDRKGDKLPVDGGGADGRGEDFDGLILPGGGQNPDTLRMDEKAVGFVR